MAEIGDARHCLADAHAVDRAALRGDRHALPLEQQVGIDVAQQWPDRAGRGRAIGRRPRANVDHAVSQSRADAELAVGGNREGKLRQVAAQPERAVFDAALEDRVPQPCHRFGPGRERHVAVRLLCGEPRDAAGDVDRTAAGARLRRPPDAARADGQIRVFEQQRVDAGFGPLARFVFDVRLQLAESEARFLEHAGKLDHRIMRSEPQRGRAAIQLHVATQPLEAWRTDLATFRRWLRRKRKLIKARLRRQRAPFGFGAFPAHRDFGQPASRRIARDRLADRGAQRHMGRNAGEAGQIDPRALELEQLRPAAAGACVAVAEVERREARSVRQIEGHTDQRQLLPAARLVPPTALRDATLQRAHFQRLKFGREPRIDVFEREVGRGADDLERIEPYPGAHRSVGATDIDRRMDPLVGTGEIDIVELGEQLTAPAAKVGAAREGTGTELAAQVDRRGERRWRRQVQTEAIAREAGFDEQIGIREQEFARRARAFIAQLHARVHDDHVPLGQQPFEQLVVAAVVLGIDDDAGHRDGPAFEQRNLEFRRIDAELRKARFQRGNAGP